MKSKDQILLEEAYLSTLNNGSLKKGQVSDDQMLQELMFAKNQARKLYDFEVPEDVVMDIEMTLQKVMKDLTPGASKHDSILKDLTRLKQLANTLHQYDVPEDVVLELESAIQHVQMMSLKRPLR